MATPESASPSVLDSIYRRRATRSFTPKPVDESTVRELLRAAVQAPTAMHLEPWAFVVVQDRALLARISDRAKLLMTGQQATGHHALVREPNAPHQAIRQLDAAFNIFYDAATLVVICGKSTGAFVTADCWLAAENLMLAATSLGLATCPIGFAVAALNDAEIKAELGIPSEVSAVAPIIVGFAAAAPPPSPRRDPDILSWKK